MPKTCDHINSVNLKIKRTFEVRGNRRLFEIKKKKEGIAIWETLIQAEGQVMSQLGEKSNGHL